MLDDSVIEPKCRLRKKLAPKRYTKLNPNPNPPTIVDNPEKILRKLKFKPPESETSTSTLLRTTTLHAQLIALEDFSFDLNFEFSLFKSKSESSLSETLFDPVKLESYVQSYKASSDKLDNMVW